MSDVRHGTRSMYVGLGCRCSECRAANAAYALRRIAERTELLRLGKLEVRHGTRHAYSGCGCRCEVCRMANSEYMRRYNRSKVRS